MPDPSFLLERSEWDSIAQEADDEPDGEYILTYFLGRHGQALHNSIKNYADALGLKILNVNGTYYEQDQIFPSPQSFVRLIRDARAVFTDSFHGSVFSILMGTPFVVFERPDRPRDSSGRSDQFFRIEQLLNKYQLHYSFIKDEASQTNYSEIFGREQREGFPNSLEIIEAERLKGTSFLRSILKAGGMIN